MQFKALFVAASLSFGALTTAEPSCIETPPLAGETYVLGFPLCGITGYTQTPGNYVETTFLESGSDVNSCMEACQGEIPNCQSIAFDSESGTCLFYSATVQCTQLWESEDSDFIHYDTACTV